MTTPSMIRRVSEVSAGDRRLGKHKRLTTEELAAVRTANAAAVASLGPKRALLAELRAQHSLAEGEAKLMLEADIKAVKRGADRAKLEEDRADRVLVTTPKGVVVVRSKSVVAALSAVAERAAAAAAQKKA